MTKELAYPAKSFYIIDSNDRVRMNMALDNIFNLLKDPFGKDATICLPVNGRAGGQFEKRSALSTADRIAELRDKGVRFPLCNNCLAALDLDRDKLVEGCEVVPAGVVEPVRLQRDGFAYIKP